MTITSAFLTECDLRVVSDDVFMLLRDFQYRSAILTAIVVVPAGFVTDLASVPRAPLAYWIFGGRAKKPAIVHDFLYQTHVCGTQDIADRVFLEAMEVDGLGSFYRDAMFAAVRDYGGSTWASGPSRLHILNPGKGWKPLEPA